MNENQASDYGPAERHQHGNYVLEDTMKAGVKRARNIDHTTLDRLARQRKLGRGPEENALLLSVGNEYYALSYRAGLSPYPAPISLEGVRGGSNNPEGRQEAHERLRAADIAIGPSQASVMFFCVVEDHSPVGWERKREFPARHGHGLAFLVDALRLLAKHWGRV